MDVLWTVSSVYLAVSRSKSAWMPIMNVQVMIDWPQYSSTRPLRLWWRPVWIVLYLSFRYSMSVCSLNLNQWITLSQWQHQDTSHDKLKCYKTRGRVCSVEIMCVSKVIHTVSEVKHKSVSDWFDSLVTVVSVWMFIDWLCRTGWWEDESKDPEHSSGEFSGE